MCACVIVLQVSRLLSDLLGDVCQPFYYGPLELDPNISIRKALKVSEFIVQRFSVI